MTPPAKLAFGRLPVPPEPGSIQFLDGYFPVLQAGRYDITVTHTVTGDGTTEGYDATQGFEVRGPEFAIDTGIVRSFFPPEGGADDFAQTIPYIVLADPNLPWERSLVPSGGQSDASDPMAWCALVVLAADEVRLQPDTNTPVITSTVSDFLAMDPKVLKPTLPAGWVPSDVLASQCQSIRIPGIAFNDVMPNRTDLPFLSHCRAVSAESDAALLSVVLGNRFAIPDTSSDAAGPQKYFVHLVSLEGYADHLGPDGTPIPTQPNSSELMDVQLASLFNWTFTSQPSAGTSFSSLMQGLIDSEQSTPALCLPFDEGADVPQSVKDRLDQGYAPLTFVSGAAEESIAWMRGPFTPVVPQPLPEVGDPAQPIDSARTSDELMIYLAEQGMFDLTYAAAWNIGRGLALADADFAMAANTLRREVQRSLAILAQRINLAHHGRASELADLLERSSGRRTFTQQIGAGLGQQWNEALVSARRSRQPTRGSLRPARRRRPRVNSQDMLAQPGVDATLGDQLREQIDPVAEWLADLSKLLPLPFVYMVPNPKMLPVESVRFFYVDPSWIDALTAGASSVAVHSSTDVQRFDALRTAVRAVKERNGVAVTGMLIRSQLIAGWPDLDIEATRGGAPVNLVRDDVLAPSVRLCLFDGVPDTVSVSEPYEGLNFGTENGRVFARCVTVPGLTGVQFPNVAPTLPTLRTPALNSRGGVLDVAATARSLATSAGVDAFDASSVVHLDGTPLVTTLVNPNKVTAEVPAVLLTTPRTASVQVANGSVLSSAATFTIEEPMSIETLEPGFVDVGSGEFVLRVRGVGMAPDSVVQWNSTTLASTFVSALELKAVVTADVIANTSTVNVAVLSGGETSNVLPFEIVARGPTIGQLAPRSAVAGAPGFTLFVSGTNFGDDGVVKWDGAALETTVVAPGRLTAEVPSDLLVAEGSPVITVTSGLETSGPAVFVVAGTEPLISVIRPSVAVAGSGIDFTILVNGVNFAAGAALLWNGTALPTVFDDAEQLTATVAAPLVSTPGTVSITVRSGGVDSAPVAFTVVAERPVIGLLQPTAVVAGSAAITLTVGGGFGGGDFGLQMVKAPQQQSYRPQGGAR